MKVLILQITIPHYRVPIFNKLAEQVDLTVIYSNGQVPSDAKFKTLYIPTFKMHYQIHKKNLIKLANKYDAFICMFNFSYLYVRLMKYFPKKFKLIYWGIGVSAGYNARYDENQRTAEEYFKRAKQADAMLFYSSYPVEKYSKMGIDREKLFVSNNTVEILPIEIDNQKKENILFIGSLYKQKKIMELLNNYYRAFQKNQNIPSLIIIGEGEEYENIKSWINQNDLENKITLTGGVYKEEVLKEYFEKAIMCISPDQAGLSVLKSMGYGVPYVTHKNAITGGEIFNIKNGENGILLDDFDQIESIILESVTNRDKYLKMGHRAQEYYYENRKPEKMVEGFVSAVKYVLGKEKN